MKHRVHISALVMSLVMICLSITGITAFAENTDSVTPNNKFSYSGSDVTALVNNDAYKTSNAFFCDEANIFKGEQEKRINSMVQQTADQIRMNLAVIVGGNPRSDGVTKEVANKTLIQLFGNDADTSSVCVYLDFEGQKPSYDYICTLHDAQLYYPDGGKNPRVSDLLSRMGKYLPASGDPVYPDNIESAVKECCSGLIYYKKSGLVNDVSYRNEELGKYVSVVFGMRIQTTYFPLSTPLVIVILVVGLIFVLAIFSSVRSRFGRGSYTSSTYSSGYDSGYSGYGGYRRGYRSYGRGYRHRPPPPPPGHHGGPHHGGGYHSHSGGSHGSSGGSYHNNSSSGGGGSHR